MIPATLGEDGRYSLSMGEVVRHFLRGVGSVFEIWPAPEGSSVEDFTDWFVHDRPDDLTMIGLDMRRAMMSYTDMLSADERARIEDELGPGEQHPFEKRLGLGPTTPAKGDADQLTFSFCE